MRIRLLLLIAVAALVTSGCHRNRLPDGVMDHGRMVAFLAEAYILEGYYAVETSFSYDSLSPEMLSAYDALLTRHGVTMQQVDASMEYYSHHPDDYSAINREVLALLEKAEATDSVVVEPVAVKVVHGM